MEIEAREMLRLRKILFEIYSKRTGKSTETIHADCERNKWLSSEEMLEYGLADSLLSHLKSSKKGEA